MADVDKEIESSTLNDILKIIKIATYPLSILIFVIVLSIKVYQLDISTLLSNIQFSDLLSIFLAFFSIGISIAFYFKASETSNQFYDNTYKFTQHTSEILGRIESGFGERLSNINESYHKLDDTMKRYYSSNNVVQEKISEKEKSIEEEKNNQKEIIDTLFNNSSLDEKKQSELKKKLEESISLLEESREEIERLKNKIRKKEGIELLPKVKGYYKSVIRKLDISENSSWIDINRSLKHLIENNEISSIFIRDMKKLNIIDAENNLTLYGRRLTKQLINELNNQL